MLRVARAFGEATNQAMELGGRLSNPDFLKTLDRLFRSAVEDRASSNVSRHEMRSPARCRQKGVIQEPDWAQACVHAVNADPRRTHRL